MATCAVASDGATPGPRSSAHKETCSATGPAPGTRRRLTLARSLGDLQPALRALRNTPELREPSDAQVCGSTALLGATARARANVANLFARLPDCDVGHTHCIYGDKRWRIRLGGRQLYLQQVAAVLCDDTLAESATPFRVLSHCAPPPRCARATLEPDMNGERRPTGPTDFICINPRHFTGVEFEAPRKRKRSVLETGRVMLNSAAGPVEYALTERMRFEHFYMQAPIVGRRRLRGRRAWQPARRPKLLP